MAKRSMTDALLNQDKEYDYSIAYPWATRNTMDPDQLSTDYMEGDIKWAVPGIIADAYNSMVKGGQMIQGEREIDPGEVTKIATEFLPGALAASAANRAGMKGAILGANVFQGGPHKYGPEGAAESLQHMGKGEGAQAYGWGRYDAGAEGVGKQYKEFVSSRANDLTDPGNLAASMVHRTPEGTVDAGMRELKRARKAMDDYPNSYKHDPNAKSTNEAAQAYLESGAALPDQGGYLYKHDLPDDAIARYLDHDKPLSEQPEVFGQLKRHWDETMGDPDIIMQRMGLTENSSGKDLYQALAGLGRDGKAASEALGRAGIPGLKYFDGMSRGKFGVQLKHKGKDYTDGPVEFATKQQADDYLKESVSKGFEAKHVDLGTRNYVTWDQEVLDRMKLLERNGENMAGGVI